MDVDEDEAIEDIQPNQRSRKRKRNMSKPEQRKRERNSGKTYKTAKGIIVLAKHFQNPDCSLTVKVNVQKKFLKNLVKMLLILFGKLEVFLAKMHFYVV